MKLAVAEFLSDKPYRKSIWGGVFFTFAFWIGLVAIGWFVYQTTDSVRMTTLVWALCWLPSLVFGGIAGGDCRPLSPQ